MYISCPDCSTSFTVDGNLIGEHGRAVKCFSCSHTWHQNPTFDEPQPQYVAPRYMVQPPPPPPPPPPPEFAPLPEPEPEPDMAPLPEPEPDPDPEPEDIPPPPEPEEVPSDEELDAMLGPEEEMEGLESFAPDAQEDISELDEDDLDELEDPEPIGSVKPENGDDLDVEEEVEPDDLPDPDPLPDGFADADDDFDFDYEDEEEGGSGSALKTMAIFLVVIIAIASAIIFPRKMIVEYWPGANAVLYDWIYLHVMRPGEGLVIRRDEPTREEIDNEDVIVVRGDITNIVDEARDVPLIRIIAHDGNGQDIQEENFSPSKSRLGAGEKINFTAILKSLPPTARRVSVIFGKMESHAPPASKGEAKKPPETPAAHK